MIAWRNIKHIPFHWLTASELYATDGHKPGSRRVHVIMDNPHLEWEIRAQAQDLAVPPRFLPDPSAASVISPLLGGSVSLTALRTKVRTSSFLPRIAQICTDFHEIFLRENS